jgi:hypothetical protein
MGSIDLAKKPMEPMESDSIDLAIWSKPQVGTVNGLRLM